MAGLPSINLRALIVGTMTPDGNAVPNSPIPVGSQALADRFFGPGSELSRMFLGYFRNNFSNEVWALPLAEPEGATAASGNIVITAAPTYAGTLHLYVAGSYVPVNIGPSDTPDEIAQAIADQINTTYTDLGTEPLPVTADATTTPGTCALTATWKGINGNDIQIMLNYYGPRGSEVTPPGLLIDLPAGFYTVDNAGVAAGGSGHAVGDVIQLPDGAAVQVLGVNGTGGINVCQVYSEGHIPGGPSAVIPPNPVAQVSTSGSGTGATFNLMWQLLNRGFLSGGAGTPVMDAAIAAIQKEAFEYVAMPYTDSQSLFDWDQEYGFTDQGRWGWQRQQFGHVFCAKRGTYADLVLFGETLNSGVESIMAFEVNTPSPMFEAAAAYAAKAQRALINDPARPLQTLSLNQIKAVPIPERFNFVELNSLASNGFAIQEVGSDAQPMILREQTTYQLNLWGQSDDAYELVTTLATLAKLLRNQRQAVTSKYPRHKLAYNLRPFVAQAANDNRVNSGKRQHRPILNQAA